jgi:hypothetical protein
MKVNFGKTADDYKIHRQDSSMLKDGEKHEF